VSDGTNGVQRTITNVEIFDPDRSPGTDARRVPPTASLAADSRNLIQYWASADKTQPTKHDAQLLKFTQDDK